VNILQEEKALSCASPEWNFPFNLLSKQTSQHNIAAELEKSQRKGKEGEKIDN
jgi:hypothetical protein